MSLHYANIRDFEKTALHESRTTEKYTANVLTIKTTETGNCGGPAGKICTIYGKGL